MNGERKFLRLGVYWTTDDFEKRAGDNKGEDWRAFYDQSKFEKALEAMISQHDANHGITWHHVDAYLDDYCKIIDL